MSNADDPAVSLNSADLNVLVFAVSIVGISVMVLLFVNEVRFYMTPYIENEVSFMNCVRVRFLHCILPCSPPHRKVRREV